MDCHLKKVGQSNMESTSIDEKTLRVCHKTSDVIRECLRSELSRFVLLF